MLISRSTLAGLRNALPGIAPELRCAVVPCDINPLHLVRAGAGGFGRATYFGMPGGVEAGGLGSAWRAVASGHDRLDRLTAEVKAAGFPAEAVLPVGFSFRPEGPAGAAWDGFPAAVATLPAVTVIAGRGATHMVLAVAAGTDPEELLDALARLEEPAPPRVPDAGEAVIESHPPPGMWREAVADTVAGIQAGALRKVVLAREVVVRTRAVAEPFSVLALLRAGHPQCYAFGWQEGDATFVGASPELLVSRAGDAVRSHPLAGSAPRGEGDDDGLLGQTLLMSVKDRSEHALVVDDIASRLRLLTASLDVPEQPTLRRLANVQHLSTEVTGRLVVDRSVLELAGDLHPTPAVGGVPRSDALAYIAKVETSERGWYTGGIGWMAPGGDGEVAIALRCGLLRSGAAHLYAGAGIVAGSDPEAELVETRLKLRPLADLLAIT